MGLDSPTHACYAAIIEPTGQIFSDQTGRFIIPSSTGNNYVMIVYDYDSNFIFAQPFRNRTAPCLLAAFTALHKRLCLAGLRPKLQRLDNECSASLKAFMTDEGIDYQLVPPAVHRRNAAERAIRTFQNHFIAGLCSVDKDFPLHLWDHLLPQAELTLNLLRGSRLNPKLSAWAQVHGTYDYNRVPLAPPGCRVLVHEKPQNRTTWSPTPLMVGMLALQWSPIGVTVSGCGTPVLYAFAIRFHGSPPRSLCLKTHLPTSFAPVYRTLLMPSSTPTHVHLCLPFFPLIRPPYNS
jgi:hypothetical protein